MSKGETLSGGKRVLMWVLVLGLTLGAGAGAVLLWRAGLLVRAEGPWDAVVLAGLGAVYVGGCVCALRP
jgi:hypothetical protein